MKINFLLIFILLCVIVIGITTVYHYSKSNGLNYFQTWISITNEIFGGSTSLTTSGHQFLAYLIFSGLFILLLAILKFQYFPQTEYFTNLFISSFFLILLAIFYSIIKGVMSPGQLSGILASPFISRIAVTYKQCLYFTLPHLFVIVIFVLLIPAIIPQGDVFKRELERYDIHIPKKINFEKYHLRAKNWGEKNNTGITFIGYNAKYKTPAFITDDERLRHVEILGSTGTGKTSSLIFPMLKQDMEKGRGIILIDAKGDLSATKTVYQLAKDTGREKDLLFFSATETDKSNTYNPLLLGNPTQLKDKVIGIIEFTEPHYKRECESGLQTLFAEYSNNFPPSFIPLSGTKLDGDTFNSESFRWKINTTKAKRDIKKPAGRTSGLSEFLRYS